MTLQDILDHMTYGELSQLFIGSGDGGEAGVMPAGSIQRLLPPIILGLTELHKRFLLQEKILTVELDGRSSYVILSDFAESNAGATQYIKDAADPYQNELIKVERVEGMYNSEVVSIPLNQRDNTCSILTPSLNILMVPTDTELAPWLLETTLLSVIYRADHGVIDRAAAIASPTTTTINLPNTYLEALLCYVAGRITTPMGFSGETHEGNNYMGKFEAACALLRRQGMEVMIDETVPVALERGWV